MDNTTYNTNKILRLIIDIIEYRHKNNIESPYLIIYSSIKDLFSSDNYKRELNTYKNQGNNLDITNIYDTASLIINNKIYKWCYDINDEIFCTVNDDYKLIWINNENEEFKSLKKYNIQMQDLILYSVTLIDYINFGGIMGLEMDYFKKNLDVNITPTGEIEFIGKSINESKEKIELSFKDLFIPVFNSNEKLNSLKERLKNKGFLDDKFMWIGITKKKNELAYLYWFLNEKRILKNNSFRNQIKVFYKEFGLVVYNDKEKVKDGYSTIRNLQQYTNNDTYRDYETFLSDWIKLE